MLARAPDEGDGMTRPGRPRESGKREVDDYRHDEAQRLNNPEAGLARYETEKPPTKQYEYDPRMDPQLVWAGKAERTSFEVDAVSVHVHERLSAEAIISTLRKEEPQLALAILSWTATGRSSSTSMRSTGPTG
jgi:3-deoxy-D-manno-octulosonic-acid transferase